jgi:hypothetical protein
MNTIDTKTISAKLNAVVRSWADSVTAGLACLRESLRSLTATHDDGPTPYGNIMSLVAHLCDHDEALRMWVLRWIAYQLRTPGAKMSTALVFNGGEGSGKTLFLRYVVSQLSHGETPWIYGRQLQNVFNDWAADGGLVIVDGPFSQAHVARMKHYMSSAEVTIHRRSRDSLTIPNTLNFIYQSNADDFSIIGSRRFAVIDVPPAREKVFYHAVLHEIACGGVDTFRQYLLRTLDMGSFHAGTPMPAPKRQTVQEDLVAVLPKGSVQWNG